MEDDIEESAEECECIEIRYYIVKLHKGFSNKGTS